VSKFTAVIGQSSYELPEEVCTLDDVVTALTAHGVTEFKVYQLVGDYRPENKVINVLDKENV
jgi:hypothetical protein